MELDSIEDIPWVDKSLFNQSVGFYQKHFSFLIFTSALTLVFGFAVKPNSATILKTGKLLDPELSYKRYLSTMNRIGKFFMMSFNRKESYKALNTVRKMHSLANKQVEKMETRNEQIDKANLDGEWKRELALAIRKDLDYIDTSSAPEQVLTWEPPLPINQLNMAVTQFGFFGPVWLFSRVYGIKNRMEETKGVIHAWAIFGRLLGIKDEFNVCINPDPELYDKLFLNFIVASLKTMDETVISMQKAFADAFTRRVPVITYKAMLYGGLMQFQDFKGEHLWKLMDWRDKLSIYVLGSWAWTVRNIILCRWISHVFIAIWLQTQFWLNLK